MNEEDLLKKMRVLIKEEVRSVKDIVEMVKRKVDSQELYSSTTAENVRRVKEQQSIMNEKLDEHGKILNAHGKIIEEHGRILGRHEDVLKVLVADVHNIDKTTKATYELIKITYENTKREIDEIKDNVGLPKTSSILESLKAA